jgi:hypothetical protein
VDPPLANGFAYMVSNENCWSTSPNAKGSKILKDEVRHVSDVFVSSDSMFRPSRVAHPSTPSMTPIRSTRPAMPSQVGGVDCARHGFKRPTGVVDLQKGERYVSCLFIAQPILMYQSATPIWTSRSFLHFCPLSVPASRVSSSLTT